MGITKRSTLPGRAVLALFLVSAAGLVYEIVLTRAFSLLFQYHYAFLAVSLAILGLGLGALAASWLSARNPERFEVAPSVARPSDPATGGVTTNLGGGFSAATLIALGLSYPLVPLLLVALPLAGSPLAAAAVAIVPFILTGLFDALIFARCPAESGLLHAADLAGAAAGVPAALGLLALWGALNVAILLGAVAALAAVLLALSCPARRLQAGALFSLVLGAGLLLFNLGRGAIVLSPARQASAPRDKTMIGLLRDPSLQARIVYTAWDPFARVDVVETTDPTAKLVFTDGGAGSYMLRFDGDLERLASLRHTPEYLPFTLGPAGRTLILGAGAGKDLLLALLAGCDSITAVEVNPAMVRAARRFAAYNGGILDRPGVHLVVGDGRAFVEREAESYDLIYLNLVYTQAAEPAGQALAESYVFTRQAFRSYLRRLSAGGRLAIISHSGLEGSRAALTGLVALVDGGEPWPQALGHLALLMLPADDPSGRLTVMVLSREPLSEGELGALAAGAERAGLEPLFLPGVFEATLAPLAQGMRLADFLAADPRYDLRPADDDRPFFFKLDPGLPRPIAEALAGAAILLAGLVALALSAGAGRFPPVARRPWAVMALCVALMGVGFMLLEVSLIQRFQLLVGSPVLSLGAVLASLLLGGALGSALSQRWLAPDLPWRATIAALGIGMAGLAYSLALPPLLRYLLPASLAWRVLAVAILTGLLAVPMGIPFPSTLRLASGRHGAGIPWLWGINGASSALGSTLAVVIAMTWGFRWTMMAGIAAYLVLAALLSSEDLTGFRKPVRSAEKPGG